MAITVFFNNNSNKSSHRSKYLEQIPKTIRILESNINLIAKFSLNFYILHLSSDKAADEQLISAQEILNSAKKLLNYIKNNNEISNDLQSRLAEKIRILENSIYLFKMIETRNVTTGLNKVSDNNHLENRLAFIDDHKTNYIARITKHKTNLIDRVVELETENQKVLNDQKMTEYEKISLKVFYKMSIRFTRRMIAEQEALLLADKIYKGIKSGTIQDITEIDAIQKGTPQAEETISMVPF